MRDVKEIMIFMVPHVSLFQKVKLPARDCVYIHLFLSRLRESNRPTHPLINISQHCESAAAPPHILDFRFKDMKKLRCNTSTTKARVYYNNSLKK